MLKYFSFQESQPPHLRNPLSMQIEEMEELDQINLDISLKDLSEDSWFAVHYNYLKSFNYDSSDISASFLVYYQIKDARAEPIGICAIKMDNSNFWFMNHENDCFEDQISSLKFRKNESEDKAYYSRLTIDLDDFIKCKANEIQHYDYNYMIMS